MEKIIYDEPINMKNITVLKKISESSNYSKIFSDRIFSISIFYNLESYFTVYLEIYARENIGCLKIKLFSPEKSFEKNMKEVLDLIPE